MITVQLVLASVTLGFTIGLLASKMTEVKRYRSLLGKAHLGWGEALKRNVELQMVKRSYETMFGVKSPLKYPDAFTSEKEEETKEL